MIVNAGCHLLQRSSFEQALHRQRHMARVGDVFIAQAERPFGGFHDAVDGLYLISVSHIEMIGNAEDRQRYQPLGRRRHIENVALLVAELQRHATARAMPGEILRGQWTSGGLKLFRHQLRQRPAIKAAEAVIRQTRQGAGEARLAETAACSGHFAAL